MHNKLIKYLKENFNSESIHTLKVEGYSETFQSDLHLVDLQKVVEDFKGEFQIDKDGGDALVDNANRVCLYIMYDKTPFDSSIPNQSAVTIFNRIGSGF